MNYSIEQLPLSHSFADLSPEFYQPAKIKVLAGAHLISINKSVGTLLNLNTTASQALQNYSDYLGGHKTLDQAKTIACIYGGHQFGVYVPQLGDGRALLLGNALGSDGRHYELALKGAGPTPFSRGGDGRAVLRSTVREYLCSEAMHALGIATTRALCVVGSNELVQRETTETAAVLLRVARTHVRFGNFEYFFYQNQHQLLQELADHIIQQHYSDLSTDKLRYRELFRRCVHATAKMIAGWQALGFAHGVLNTDNMSILGETLDYGPFGFMEDYQPDWICNHSDHYGRYAWNKQPAIGLWNLAALGHAMSPLIKEEHIKQALAEYQALFDQHWMQLMTKRLGFNEVNTDDGVLIHNWLNLLEKHKSDYHTSFRVLVDKLEDKSADSEHQQWMQEHNDLEFNTWYQQYRERFEAETDRVGRLKMMRSHNPIYVLRNYLAHNAIQKAEQQKDYRDIDTLMMLLQKPCSDIPQHQAYKQTTPDWGRALQLSCSS